MEKNKKLILSLAVGISAGLFLFLSLKKPNRSVHLYYSQTSLKLALPSPPEFTKATSFPRDYSALSNLSQSTSALLCSHFLYSPRTESTQKYLDKHFPYTTAGLLYVADLQTQGQGRTGSWDSQSGCLMFSFKFSCAAGKVLALQLAIPLTIIKAIEKLAHNCDLTNLLAKYPNDVFLNGKKLAGVLVNSISAGKKFVLTIGVGINVRNKTEFASLEQEFPGKFEKGEVLKEFLEEFAKCVEGIEEEEWGDRVVQGFKEKWMHLGKQVKVRGVDGWVVRDVSKQGVIFVENAEGKVETVANRDEIVF